MRDFLRFWWRCVVWAFAGLERGKSVADFVAPLARRLVAAALFTLPLVVARARIGSVPDLSPLLGAAVPWLPVAYFAVLVLAVAPYQVWRRERERAAAAEARLVVRLSMEAVVRREGGGKMACVVVRNLGAGPVTNCSGELRGVYEWLDGRRERVSDVHPFYLRWSGRFQSEQRPQLTFNTAAELEVVYVRPPYTGMLEVRPFQRLPHPSIQTVSGKSWLPERARYVFEIEVAADNCAPIQADCWLSVEPLGRHAKRDAGGGLLSGPLPDVTFEGSTDDGAPATDRDEA